MIENLEKINLYNEVEWEEEEKNKLFFDVEVVPSYIEGDSTRALVEQKWKTIAKILDGKKIPLESVSDGYYLADNNVIDEVFSKQFDGNLKLNTKLSNNKNDRKFQFVYDLPNEFNLAIDDTSTGKFSIVVKNSYDKTMKLELALGWWRMICANMITIPYVNKVSELSLRHRKGNFKDEFDIFLTKWIEVQLKKDTFVGIKNRIDEMKQIKELNLSINFLKYFSFAQIVYLVNILEKFSEIPIYLGGQRIQNNFSYIDDLYRTVYHDRSGLEKKREKYLDRFQDCVNLYTYDEEVNSKWGVFCLLIKAFQHLLEKHRRFNYSNHMSKHFFRTGKEV